MNIIFFFLGECIFWKYNEFHNNMYAAGTLFSLTFGDIVNQTFLNTVAEGIIGEMFLIIFMIFFYTSVQNVYVSLMINGYAKARKLIKKKKEEERKTKIIDYFPDSFEEIPSINRIEQKEIIEEEKEEDEQNKSKNKNEKRENKKEESNNIF